MKDEALKLALEALEMCEAPWTGTLDHNLTEAITAIKQALANAALDRKAENARELGLDYEPVPVQEPVAWPCEIEEADFEQDTITLKMLTSEYVVRAGKHWLSTTPPAAQRKPLTDEQRKAIVKKWCAGDGVVYEMIDLIEAAHGIKGNT
jgi:hypothetical protein